MLRTASLGIAWLASAAGCSSFEAEQDNAALAADAGGADASRADCTSKTATGVPTQQAVGGTVAWNNLADAVGLDNMPSQSGTLDSNQTTQLLVVTQLHLQVPSTARPEFENGP